MVYQKPYTFRAGNYAKSSEVNANFDTLKDFVDDLQEYIENKIIGSAPYNKADRGGDPLQTFQVAEGSDGNDAVNVDQLNSVEARVADLEAVTPFVAPTYNDGTTVTANSTISDAGVLVVRVGIGSPGYIELDGTRFEGISAQIMTFPVKAGTTVGAIHLINSAKLYT